MIDAHVHFWDGRLDWMTEEMAVLEQAYGPEELRQSLAAHSVDGVVLVQTHSSLEETKRFLALAEANDLVAGVVGWAPFAASSTSRARSRGSPSGSARSGCCSARTGRCVCSPPPTTRSWRRASMRCATSPRSA